MRRTFILLLLAAVGVWGYVVTQILAVYFGKSPSKPAAALSAPLPADALRARSRPALDTVLRDPFQPYLYAQKPAPVNAPAKVKPPLVAIEPPAVVLGGILWGDAPVAILKQDGQSELVKVGSEVWGLKVLRIERHQVTVVKQGRRFTLGY